MLNARAIHRQRQRLEVGLSESGALFQQASGEEKISIVEKRVTEA